MGVCLADLLAPAPILRVSIATGFRGLVTVDAERVACDDVATVFDKAGALLSEDPVAEAVRGALVGEAIKDAREATEALMGEAAVCRGSLRLVCVV